MIGGLLVGAILLIGAGIAKVVRPDDTARALRLAGLPVGPGLVRAGAGAEAVVGAAALVAPNPVTGGLVALSYAGFAFFILVALWRGWSLSSCGCFGEPDVPPTPLHVVVDAALAAAAALAAVSGARTGRLWSAHGAVLLFSSAVVAGLAYLVLARLPQMTARQ